MTYLDAIIIGIVQGFTEFVPISSSGHLLILQNFFGIDSDSVLVFTVMMHIGTLISICVCFWKKLWILIVEFFRALYDLIRGRDLDLEENPKRKLGIMIIIACIPTALIGLGFKDIFHSFYKSLAPTAIGLLITGFLLWIADGKKDDYETGTTSVDMQWTHALVIGTMQGLAICPGISRAGSTLTAGLISGLEKNFALNFSFLISIPAVLGSVLVEINPESISNSLTGNIGPIIVGTVASAVSGIIAIKFMTKVINKLSLRYFSFYVWAVGIFLLIFTYAI